MLKYVDGVESSPPLEVQQAGQPAQPEPLRKSQASQGYHVAHCGKFCNFNK